MAEAHLRRPRVLVVAGYAHNLSEAEKRAMDAFGAELGRAFIEHGVDIVIGGTFDTATPIATAAKAACDARGLSLSERLVTYYSEQFPPKLPRGVGQRYRLEDDDRFWPRTLVDADALVVISGLKNAAEVIGLAQTLRKPTFPVVRFGGSAAKAWRARAVHDLNWLGDDSLEAGPLADRIADAVRRLNAPERVDGQVGVLMPFNADTATVYDAIVDVCKELSEKLRSRLKVRRADDQPHAHTIIETVKKLILESEFIVVDLTDARPNVYYELGYAHGIGRHPSEVLLIAKETTAIHVDVGGLHILRYGTTESLKDLLRKRFALLVENRRREGM